MYSTYNSQFKHYIVSVCEKNLQPRNGGARKSPGLRWLWLLWLGEASGSLVSQTQHTEWQQEHRDWIRSICDHLWKGTASAWKSDSQVNYQILKVIILPIYNLYFSLFTSPVLFSAVLLNFLHHTSFPHGCWKMLSSQREEAHWRLSKKAKRKDLSHTFNVHVKAFKCSINQLPGTCWKECTVAE